jgi:MATE family multidrug resistance protein
VRFGLPSGVHLQLDLIAFAVFVLLTGRYGAVEQTANSVALSVNALAFMPVIGFGVAAGIVVGQRQGCGDSAGAMRAGWVSLAMGASYMAAVGLTFALFPHFYTRLFVGAAGTAPQTDSVYPVARLLLLWVAGWSLGDACNLVLAGALKGAGDTRFVMRFSLFCNWVLFLGGLVAIRVFRCGGFQVMWLWATVNVWIMAAGYVWRFMGGRWQNIDLLGRSEPELLPPPAQPCAAMVRDP